MILVDSDLHRPQTIVAQILSDRRLSVGADVVIFDTMVEQQNFIGNAPDPARRVQKLIRSPSFNRRLSNSRQLSAFFVLISGAVRIR